MNNLSQIFLIISCLFIPIYFIYFKREKINLSTVWLGIIITLDIFNSQKYMNLSAVLLFGAAALPYNYKQFSELKNNKPLMLIAGYFLYLCILGLYHGFLYPWEDLTGIRSFKDKAQMRTILHLGRSFLEWSCILFLIIRIQKSQETISILIKTIFFSSITLAFGAIIEIVFKVDIYHFFTAGRQLLDPQRARGLAYEPRGLSQNLAYAILLTPFVNLPKWKYIFIILFLFSGFYLTISFTGYAILGGGALLMLILFSIFRIQDLKKYKFIILGALVSIIFFSGIIFNSISSKSAYHLKERLNIVLAKNLVHKLEVFDAAAINFLNHNPKYYLFGAGPGTIYLPASNYILERDNHIWRNKFEALPHMGGVLILSNSGILGFMLFLLALTLGLRDKAHDKSNELIIGIVITALFFIQIRYHFILGFALLLSNFNLKKEFKTVG